MQMFAQKFLISVVLLGFCCAIPASATMTECTNESCFGLATTDDAFQNITVTPGLGNPYTDPSTGVEFSDPSGLLDLGGAIAAYSGLQTITISLPPSANAIEFEVSGGSELYISVTDSSGGPSGTYVNMPLASGFFGVVTDSTFASFSITNDSSSGQLTIADISIGSDDAPPPSPTPEAATLLLVATGLFLMGYFRRRMPRRAAAQAARRGTVRTMFTGITPA